MNCDSLRSWPLTVMLAHPNTSMQGRFGQALRSEGYHVRIVGSGSDAISLVRRHNIAAAFIDVSKTFERGPGLLTALRIEVPHLPVIALAGAVPNDAVAAALDLGALAFMQEPYDVEVANALLRRVLTLSRLSSRAEETERRAHDQREQCCALMEHTPDAVVLADHRGQIVQWNRSAQRLFAYTADDVLGRPLTLLMPKRYRADHQQGLARFRFTGIPRNAGITIAFHGLRKDGSEFPLELSLAAWETRQGIVYGGIMREISERRREQDRDDGAIRLGDG